MKAVCPKDPIQSGEMVGSKLKLLCETAMMQGVDNEARGSKPACQPSPCSTASSTNENIKTVCVKERSGSGTCCWFPPSFVPLNTHLARPLVPKSGVKTTKTLLHRAFGPECKKSHESCQNTPAFHIPTVNHQLGTIKDLIRENVQLKVELGEAKKEIARLKKEMSRASCNIRELRSFSGGNKISEIPLVDMIEIMQEYGSEISGQSFQKRKENPQPASIVRQFRRWNPDFLKYFFRKNGKWHPKLGKEGELQRRKQKREALRAHRRNPPQGVSVHR
mmetsp:Transcript_12681/g.18639  ORF Transcript_12681/g.18639 Transcript_12681/m.18639 type:complete len:277 (-) Transcript_12681:338-1168(-)|eukprot:CAMPEP_0194215366 /NCGR_PEP_ID=MMETSP0156-20130528/17131_1 /TAXON_ID=33649 /ORGANISM="Thalassionema nitzschioides, Strain L26-B" /LENGTH=276 /DNA_ID=CAMNT_0038943865 /DNA_START=48 /DNA_END=878 /DNA_ORIENTATION=-